MHQSFLCRAKFIHVKTWCEVLFSLLSVRCTSCWCHHGEFGSSCTELLCRKCFKRFKVFSFLVFLGLILANHTLTTIHFFHTFFSSIQSLQKQVSVMSMNLSCKLDDLQRGDRHMETSVALCEIRTQLQELTKSVESCQSEVSEVSSALKRPRFAVGHGPSSRLHVAYDGHGNMLQG